MGLSSTEPEGPASGVTAPPSLLQRVFSRHLMNIALLMLLPMLFAPFLNLQRLLVIDPDVWWHLADARLFFATHHFIRADSFSFTVTGLPWVNTEWLSEIPLWLSFRAFGLQGLYLAAWLGISANVLFVYWRSVRVAHHSGAAFYASMLAVLMMTVNCSPRTIQFAYLALSAQLAIFENPEPRRQKLLWLLPLIFCIWINLHGSWVIGIALFALYIVCGLFPVKLGVIEQEAFPKAVRNRLLAVFGASVLALLVNPYGWRLIWNPFDMVFNQTVNTGAVAEWKPLTFNTLEGFGVLAGIAVMLLASCIRGRKWRVHELAFVLFGWFAAFDHLRFTYLAAVIVTPYIAADIARSFLTEPDNKTIPVMNGLLAAVAALCMFFLFPSEQALREGIDTWFPPRLLASIQPSWHTWAWDDLGGRMTFLGKPDFYDSRVDIFEHHGILQDYLTAMYGREVFRILDKYKIDHVLVMDNMPMAYELSHACGWHETGREGKDPAVFVLFARDDQGAAVCSATKPLSAGTKRASSDLLTR